MHYTEFDNNQQESLLRSRIAGWEADHYGHEINKQAFMALPAGKDRDEGIRQSEQAQATLEASITAARDMLAELEANNTQTTTTEPAA